MSIVARTDHSDSIEKIEQLRRIFTLAAKAPVDLFCDSNLLVQLMQPLSKKLIKHAPVPAAHIPRPKDIEPSIAYFGARRSIKGFHLLPEALLIALNDTPELKIYIQAYRHPDDMVEPLCEAALTKLRAMSNMTILEKTMSNQDYNAWLQQVSAVVLPYNRDHYRAGTSGVFVEAIASGCAAVIPARTWMHAEAQEYNLSRAVICDDVTNPFAFSEAISMAIKLGSHAWVPSSSELHWLNMHRSDALLNVLTLAA